MYGINEKVYSKLMDYFKANEEIKKVILFGSRAKGLEKSNSDIDLCIQCSPRVRGSVEACIDEIIGIYSCDVVFEDKLNEEIKNQIERDGIEIYHR